MSSHSLSVMSAGSRRRICSFAMSSALAKDSAFHVSDSIVIFDIFCFLSVLGCRHTPLWLLFACEQGHFLVGHVFGVVEIGANIVQRVLGEAFCGVNYHLALVVH